MVFKLLLLCFVYVTVSTSVVRQNTLYEWNPGDEVKANGLGKYVVVGYVHDFTYVERRGLFQFSDYPPDSTLNLTFTFEPVEKEVNLTVCEMLQDWGEGKSNTTQYLQGAPAQVNDATWKFPFYNGTTSFVWHDHIFGGYFDKINGQTTTLRPDKRTFTVTMPYSEYGYILLFANETRVAVLVHGKYSAYPPTAQVVMGSSHAQEVVMYYLIIPAAVVVVTSVAIGLIVFFRCRRRNDYIPLLDLEVGDIQLTQLQGIEAALVAAKVRRVDEVNLEYGKKIGSGTSGEVYAAKLGTIHVAVKKIKMSNLTQNLKTEDIIKSISSEILILSKLDHPNILGMIGVVIGDNYSDFGIVTRLMELGNLTRTLYGEPTLLEMDLKRKIIVGIAKGMRYLHQQQPVVIHRDLKPENILLDDKHRPKITDFGISRLIENTLQAMTISGTPLYMAPESLYGGPGAFSKKSDVYGFGVILIEIVNQSRPNTGMSVEAIMMERARGEFAYTLPEDCPADLIKTASSCTRKKPSERPSFTDILIDLNEF